MADKTYVKVLPKCDIHKYISNDVTVEAKYDARTKTGQWAHMCTPCWVENRRTEQLGTGFGQELIVGDPPNVDRQAEVRRALVNGDYDALQDAVGDGDLADYL